MRTELSVGAFLALSLLAARAWADPVDTDTCLAAHEGAQRDRLAGALEASFAKLAVCANATCPHAVFKDCTQWQGELSRDLVVIEIDARDANGADDKARLRVDGKLPSWLPNGSAVVRPGAHVVTIAAGVAGVVARKEIVAKHGEKTSVLLTAPSPATPPASSKVEEPMPPPLPPPDEPPRRNVRPVTWVLAGGALVGFGVGGYFGTSALLRRNDCGVAGACSRQGIDRIDRDYIIADATIGAGVLLAGAAFYTYVKTPLTVGVGPRAIVVGAQF